MSLEPLPVYLINAFTTGSPHSGNQAGVVVFPAKDPRAEDDDYKQRIAKDIDYSETAFVVPLSEGEWSLRWFTPEVEVPLCGHATLAASRVLFSQDPSLHKIRFQTRWSGELRAERIAGEGESRNATKIQIYLPTFKGDTLTALADSAEEALKSAKENAGVLGVGEDQIVGAVHYEFLGKSAIVQLAPEVDLEGLKYDPREFSRFSKGLTIITQLKPDLTSPGRVVIHSRCHASAFGIDEDPVTGSAHAYLTAYYLLTSAKSTIPQHLVSDKVEDIVLDAKQVSARGGALECKLADGGVVAITGTACEMAKGTLSLW